MRTLCVCVAVLGALFAASACASSIPGPIAGGTPSNVVTSPTATPLYVAADLQSVMPTEAQIAGWQTATRADLTGPYTLTSNVNPGEKPAIDSAGFVAGQRSTIGNPGGTAINVVRVSAEVFTSPDAATAAMQYYASALAALGYTNSASGAGLPSPSAAVWASNGFIAPQFASGSAPKAFAFVWTVRNLLIVVRAGGDGNATNDEALQWAVLVNSNVRTR